MTFFFQGPMVTTKKSPGISHRGFRPPFRNRGAFLWGTTSEVFLNWDRSWGQHHLGFLSHAVISLAMKLNQKICNPQPVGYLLLVDVGCFVVVLFGWLVVAVVLVQYCLCFRLLDFFNPPKRWSLQINGGKRHQQRRTPKYHWWFRNPANSPVELGNLSTYLQGFFTSQVVVWDFWSINRSTEFLSNDFHHEQSLGNKEPFHWSLQTLSYKKT